MGKREFVNLEKGTEMDNYFLWEAKVWEIFSVSEKSLE